MDNDFRLDVSHFPKELTLLLSLMSMEEGESILPNIRDWLGDVNWDRFMELAGHHRVYPILYTKLQKINVTWVPPHVIQALHKDYQNNTFLMLHLSSEMEQLCKMLSEFNIRTLVLKGPVLAADLYGNISLRTSRDVDILIPIHDLGPAEELLGRLGYTKVEYPRTVLNDWKWRHHHITFFHPEKRVTLEIHWRLGPGPAKEPGFNELWARKRLSKITSNSVYYLGREDLFLFLVSHGARHGWSRLRWLVDIDQISKQNLESTKLCSLLKKYKHLHIGAQALILAAQLLHTPLTAEIEFITTGKRARRLAHDALFYIHQMVNLHTFPVPAEVSKYHKYHLFSLMTYKHKILFVMSFLYPYPEDTDILKLPKHLHFLYFPLRPVLWAWRKTKKHALSQGGM